MNFQDCYKHVLKKEDSMNKKDNNLEIFSFNNQETINN